VLLKPTPAREKLARRLQIQVCDGNRSRFELLRQLRLPSCGPGGKRDHRRLKAGTIQSQSKIRQAPFGAADIQFRNHQRHAKRTASLGRIILARRRRHSPVAGVSAKKYS
jgi:hypothetical protein